MRRAGVVVGLVVVGYLVVFSPGGRRFVRGARAGWAAATSGP